MSTAYVTATKLHPTRQLIVSGFALIIALATLTVSSSAMALTSPLLSKRQEGSSDITAFTKWTALMPRYETQNSASGDQCIGKGCLNQKWEALLTELEGKSPQTQIDRVNAFFNRMTYVTDQKNYGAADYWQTPYELMERGGDCEDYAIAKYISLKRLGFSESDMRILIVRDGKLGGTIHAVLEVKLDGDAQLLDNQARDVKLVAQVMHYSPVYAINESRWWAYK
jgi:predicted transglutaminase-like cysteine proteinase